MSQMIQNQWAECAKIVQNQRNEVKQREPGHRNDPNGPKSIIKMNRNGAKYPNKSPVYKV